MTDTFDRLVKGEPPSPELANDWTRQRESAREFCRRFDEDTDTQLLADEVGMGKTYVAMAAMAKMLLGRKKKRALLLTPSSAVLRAKWEQEIRSFSDIYVQGAGSLRPLVVRDFWDLLSNLHDHESEPLARVTQGLLGSLLLSVWTYGLRKKWIRNSKGNRWSQLKKLKWSDPEAMRFKSDYSLPAWEAFLEKTNSRENGAIRMLVVKEMRDPDSEVVDAAIAKIKRLFREFTARQDEFEPNVLILGMSALGRRPNTNNENLQVFATFVLSRLLKGRWESTCKDILKALKKVSGLLGDVDIKRLQALGSVDLYRMAGCVDRVLADDPDLHARWNQIWPAPAAVGDRGVQDFFDQLLDGVVRTKLADSGIALAVIDEAHNWKSGANGAKRFKALLAPGIPYKLLMSATPFQLEEGEMKAIFGYAMKAGGETAATLKRMYEGGESSLVARCLGASSRFAKALAQLDPREADSLVQLNEIATPDMRGWLTQAGALGSMTSEGLARLYRRAVDYRDTTDALMGQQRKIMIRHIKDRTHRRFHCGSDFGATQGTARTAMYRTSGLPSEEHEFVNYLAMRLDQRLRTLVPGEAGSDAAAHLMRGLSSSKAAFKASSQSRLSKLAIAADPTWQSHFRLFETTLAEYSHIKVRTTVDRAFSNYVQGKKTLIFCERVSTLEEISVQLRERIARHWTLESEEVACVRRSVKEDPLFTDIPLYRSWLRTQPSASPVDLQSTEARAFVSGSLASARAIATERRILRLLDLWALSRHGSAAAAKGSIAMRMLNALAEQVGMPSPNLDLLHVILDRKSVQLNADDSVSRLHDRVALAFASQNMWIHEVPGGTTPVDDVAFDRALWTLLEREAANTMPADGHPKPENLAAFHGILMALQEGLQKVTLRPDLLRRYFQESAGTTGPGDAIGAAAAIHQGMRSNARAESTWSKTVRFVEALGRANGSMNPVDQTNTQRRSLWRGVNLQAQDDAEDLIVIALDGSVSPDRRVTVCAAFNAPLAPDILLCTAIGSEGIDLHRECAEVIHHDLPWNPARIEQRIGRIDRVNRLSEASGGKVMVGIPFLANDYEQHQYDTVLSRAQLFEVLMGRPEFDVSTDEEDYDDEEKGRVKECDADADMSRSLSVPTLPPTLVDWLRVDLSLSSNLRQPKM